MHGSGDGPHCDFLNSLILHRIATLLTHAVMLYNSGLLCNNLNYPRFVHLIQGMCMHVSEAISLCTHVLIRHDAVHKPLQQPYDGPCKVLQRNDKYYVVDINGSHDTVSLDHLKPAYLEPPAEVEKDAQPGPPTFGTPYSHYFPYSQG